MKLDKLTRLNQEDLKLGMEVTILGLIGANTRRRGKLAGKKYIITQEDIDNPVKMYYLDTRRAKTISKIFYDREIINRGSDGTLYLKMGVKRKHYGDDLDYETMNSFSNYETTTGEGLLTKTTRSANSDDVKYE